jgi:hypothetical protein
VFEMLASLSLPQPYVRSLVVSMASRVNSIVPLLVASSFAILPTTVTRRPGVSVTAGLWRVDADRCLRGTSGESRAMTDGERGV